MTSRGISVVNANDLFNYRNKVICFFVGPVKKSSSIWEKSPRDFVIAVKHRYSAKSNNLPPDALLPEIKDSPSINKSQATRIFF